MKRAALALVATVLVSAGLPPAQGQDAVVKVCPGGQSDAVLRSGQFTTIAKPPALDQIRTFAAGGGDGQLLLASDGKSLMRSIDGGCAWRAVAFSAPDGGPVDAVAPKIDQLVIPEGGDKAYMVLSGVGDTAVPQLMTSADGGETWGDSGSGLPAAGRFRELVPAPDDPNVLYLIAGTAEGLRPADGVVPSGGLYATEDGGQSWAQRDAGVAIDSLAVDPIDAKDLWIVRADHSVEVSIDGGTTFSVVTPPSDADPNTPDDLWREVTVAHQLPSNPLVAVFATNGRDGSVTRGAFTADLGAHWQALDTDGLGPVGGAVFGRSPAQLFWAAGSASTAFHGPGFHVLDREGLHFVDIDGLDLRSLEDPVNVIASGGGTDRYRAIFMRRDAPGEDPPLEDLIVRYDPPAPDPNDSGLAAAGPCKNNSVPGAQDVVHKPVGFQPGQLDLQLEPGQPLRTDLRAALPPSPTPLDVFFLIDHSTSMDPAIEGLFCSITRMARELPRRGVDAHFGLGGYSDYFLKTYQRYVDISAPGPHISEALRGLFTYGGVHEPIRSALYQTATGDGLNVTAEDPNGQGPGGTGGGRRVQRRVDPGQQANFRDGSLKLALVIGDEPYEEDTDGEPAREDVVRALVKKGILAVGVQVLTPIDESIREVVDTNDPLDPDGKDHSPQRQLRLRQQLEYFAQETGALAPRGGVDCDGGGAPDVEGGEPLVCSILENGIQRQLDETLITLLRGIEDRRDVRIVPAKSPLQVSVESGEFADLDVTRSHDLQATGVIGCTEEQAGRRYPIAFDVMVGDRRVGTLEGRALCGQQEEPAVVPPVKPRKPAPPARPDPAPSSPQPQPAPPAAPVPPAAQAAVAVAPPPPPPSPAPAGSVQLQPMSAQAPSASSAAAPAPGAAAGQEHKQVNPKLAVIRSDGAEDSAPLSGAELGMSELHMTALGTGALAITGAFGAAVLGRRRRREREPAPARVRR